MRWWLVGRVKLLGRKAEECLPLFWVFAERVKSAATAETTVLAVGLLVLTPGWPGNGQLDLVV